MRSQIAGRSPFIPVRPPPGAAEEAPAYQPPQANVPLGGPPVGIEPEEPPSYRETLEANMAAMRMTVAALDQIESDLRRGLHAFDGEAQKFTEDRAAGNADAGALSASAGKLVACHDLTQEMQRQLGHPRQKLLELEGQFRLQFPLAAQVPGAVRNAHAQTGQVLGPVAPPVIVHVAPEHKQLTGLEAFNQAAAGVEARVRSGLVNFIANRLGVKPCTAENLKWKLIHEIRGFNDLHRDVQALAEQFGRLSPQERASSGIAQRIRDEAALKAAPKQAQPPPHRVPALAPLQPARPVAHVKAAKPRPMAPSLVDRFRQAEDPAVSQLLAQHICKQLRSWGHAPGDAAWERMEDWCDLSRLGKDEKQLARLFQQLGDADRAASDTMKLVKEFMRSHEQKAADRPRAAGSRAAVAPAHAREELEILSAQHDRQIDIMKALEKKIEFIQGEVVASDRIQASEIVASTKCNFANQSVVERATGHRDYVKLCAPVRDLVRHIAEYEDAFLANQERISDINKLKEQLGMLVVHDKRHEAARSAAAAKKPEQIDRGSMLFSRKQMALERGAPARLPAAADTRAKDELALLVAKHQDDSELMKKLGREMADMEKNLSDAQLYHAQSVVGHAKCDPGSMSVLWKVKHHPAFEALTNPLQELALTSARFEDLFRAKRERTADINRLKESLGMAT